MKLRALEPQDLDFLYTLENLPDVSNVSWGSAPVSRFLLWQYLQNYTADISRDGQLMLMAEEDGALVGTVELTEYDGINERAMVGLAVAPEWRGKGLGAQMLEETCQYGRRIGLHQLAAIVPKDNPASLALFQGAKFKSCGCLRSWLRRGRSYEDCLILQRFL